MAEGEGLPARCARPFVGVPKENPGTPRGEPEGSHLLPASSFTPGIKKPAIESRFFLIRGGGGGIRTLEAFRLTHFPGVLLQPLGHLTELLGNLYQLKLKHKKTTD